MREGGKEEGGYNMIRFKRSRPAKSCFYVVSVLETLRGEYRTIMLDVNTRIRKGVNPPPLHHPVKI